MAGQEQMVSNSAEKDLDCILGKKVFTERIIKH